MTSAVISTFLFKNKNELGITFLYETDYSVTFENDDYFFTEAFNVSFGYPPLKGLWIYNKNKDGSPGDIITPNSRVLNLIKLKI